MPVQSQLFLPDGLGGTSSRRRAGLGLSLAIVAILALSASATSQEPAPAETSGSTAESSGSEESRAEARARRNAERQAEKEARRAARRWDIQDLDPTVDPDDPRLRFQVTFSEESGGGTAVAFADELRQIGEIYQMSGNVEVVYQDIRVRADQADVNREHKTVIALGNVILDQGPTRLTGATLEFDMEKETGKLVEAAGYADPGFYFRGAEIEKVGTLDYRVTDAVFTSCDQKNPSWSFRTGRTDVTIDGFARTRNATLKVKKMPVFYWPYIAWPVKTDRSSGMLVPKPGRSSRRGYELGLAWYQTVGRSLDTTFYVDLSSLDYHGFGNEIRYQPTAGTSGRFEGLIIQDPVQEQNRWKLNYNHQSYDLPFGMRGIVQVQEVSDINYYQDFERSIGRFSRRQLYSTAYLSGNWGRQSLNLLFDQRQTFLNFNRDPVRFRQLPEAEYKLRSTRLGTTPLYLQARASASLLDVFRNEFNQSRYTRFHLFPEVSLPFRATSWLSMTVNVGARYTRWGDSLRTRREVNRSEDGQAFRDEGLSRFSPTVFAEFVGPSFSRIFEPEGKRISKMKHLIEPRIAYARVPLFEEDNRVPLFDEIDLISGGHFLRYALINRFLAKPPGEGVSAREVISFQLFRLRSLDEDEPLQFSRIDPEVTDQNGPLGVSFRLLPSLSTLFQFETRYNTLFGGIEQTAVSGTFRVGSHSLGLRLAGRANVERDTTLRQQVSVSAGLNVWPGRMRVVTFTTYDRVARQATNTSLGIIYTGSCWGVSVNYSNFTTFQRPEGDRQIRFAISLKNVGTFLDLTTGGQQTL